MNPLTKSYLAVTNFLRDRAERLRGRDDRGAGMIEYAALAVLALAVVFALLETADIDTVIGDGVTDALDSIFDLSPN